MKCPKCGCEVGTKNFCSRCGADLRLGVRDEKRDGRQRLDSTTKSYRLSRDDRFDVRSDEKQADAPQERGSKLGVFQWITLILSVAVCCLLVIFTSSALIFIFGLELDYLSQDITNLGLISFCVLSVAFMAVPISVIYRSIRIMLSKRSIRRAWIGLVVECGSLVLVCLILQFAIDPLYMSILPTMGSLGKGLYYFSSHIWYGISFFIFPLAGVLVLVMVQVARSRLDEAI